MTGNNNEGNTHAQDGTEQIKPGICNECKYKIQPEKEAVVVVGSWDFSHERCVETETNQEGA